MMQARSPFRFALLTCAYLAACSDGSGEAELDSSSPEVDAEDAGRTARDASTQDDEDDAAMPALDGGNSARLDAGRDARSDTARDAETTPARDASRDTGSEPPKNDASTADGGASNLDGWKLVWSDEFEGATGTLPDAQRWGFETGGDGWGNNQQEFDTNRGENASLDGSGQLVITARKETYMNRGYTSARIKTQGKFEHTYGRYESRMQIPFGQGMWPAFWMLGNDIGSAGWPTCGEIDIMENIGKEPDTVHGTVHGPGYSGGAGIGAPSKIASGRFADGYHVFAIEWEKEVIRWYVDGKLYQTRTPKDLPAGKKWVYDHPFFIILNLAVGGQWPGDPDGTTTFPQTLKVDYVRVYDRAP
jgi:beta-glucanase (GH16 family)